MRIGENVWSTSARTSRFTVCLRSSGGVGDRRGISEESLGGPYGQKRMSRYIDIRRRAESDLRSRMRVAGISVRIINGWRREDQAKMIRDERPREARARGWWMPKARWEGIGIDNRGRTKWG